MSLAPALSSRVFERRRRWVSNLATAAALLAWAAASLYLPVYLLPGPWVVVQRLGEFLADRHMWFHIAASVGHVAVSLVISVLAGSVLAGLAHYAPAFRLLVHGRIAPFLNSFAGIAWILIGILWFGLNHVTVVFAISMVLIPFAIINMRVGYEAIDAELLEMARSFGRGRMQRFSRIVLPSLLPFLFSTTRICFGVAWKIALTAELFGGNSGFGYLFNLARQQYDTALVFVVIGIIVLFVYGVDRFVFEPLQLRLMKQYEIA